MNGHALAQGEIHAHAAQEFQGGGDVAQMGDVGQVHRPFGQQGPGEDGQGGILGAGDADLADEPFTALDEEFIHQKCSVCRRDSEGVRARYPDTRWPPPSQDRSAPRGSRRPGGEPGIAPPDRPV